MPLEPLYVNAVGYL